jgi:hypothetical protein
MFISTIIQQLKYKKPVRECKTTCFLSYATMIL